jgi:hypothetical protein
MSALLTLRTIRVFPIVFVLLFSVAQAQEDTSAPLIRLLGALPDNSAVTESLSYADYRAITAARPGAPLITTAEDWLALDGTSGEDAWFGAFLGLSSGPQDFVTSTFTQPVEAREAIGFDPYTVERAISYGNPPEQVSILEGNFDEDLIGEAYAAREYEQNSLEGMTLWCGDDTCEGTRQDLPSRNPADPFGGNLGRRQPVLVGEDLIASSPSIERLQEQAQAIAGITPTLADNPDYRAVAEAITQDGTLLQAWFINPTDISPLSEILLLPDLSAEELEELSTELAARFVPLPQYDLVAFADTATETEQIAQVALVYESADQANEASDILQQRIASYESLVTQLPMQEMLEDRGLTSIETEVYEGDERSVLLVKLHAPLPGLEPSSDDPPVSSSLLFRTLVDMYLRRDIGWLASAF